MIVGSRGINFDNGVSTFNTKLYSASDPSINKKCYQEVGDKAKVLKARIDSVDVYKDKVIVVGFCDSDEKYTFDKGTEILMRNGTYKPVEKLHFGDLCMTKAEIKPLNHIGEVKYVSEVYSDDYLVAIDVQDNTKRSIENVALNNGVYVKV